jgi:guanylate kinase
MSDTRRRARRASPGEVDGKDYHFLSLERFMARRAAGEFAESAEVHGNMYGTLKSEIATLLERGEHPVMDIDVQGARQFVSAFPESVLVFLLPPSAETLLNRLTGRNSESRAAVLHRLTSARDELAAVGAYQYVVVNDDLERAYTQVSAIVDAETVRHRRLPLLSERVHQLVEELDRQITHYARS